MGRDVSTIPISRFTDEHERACFICCNNYTSYRLSLGTGPINDAVTFAKMAKRLGYDIFFTHNPKRRTFLNYLDKFLQNTTKDLVFYYVGHGTQVKDIHGDEDDGYDEAFVFDDGNVIDDELVDHLINNKREGMKLILVTDACHSGSIWDIQGGNVNGRKLPSNVVSVSAASDRQTAKQLMIERQEQGVFTHTMSKILKEDSAITPKALQTRMRKSLARYGQTCTIASTSPEMLNEPFME